MIRKNVNFCNRALFSLISLLLVALLQGCVSNDDLYARYDSGACLLDVSALATTTDTPAAVEHSHPNWVPAVYFASNGHTLTAIEELHLQTTLRVLKRYPQLLLGLQGYTDSRGSAAYNLALADRRIASVRKFLVDNGLDSSRIISQPLGVGLPQIGSDITAAQATNRRVGLNALDISGRPVPLLFPADIRQRSIHVLHRQSTSVVPDAAPAPVPASALPSRKSAMPEKQIPSKTKPVIRGNHRVH